MEFDREAAGKLLALLAPRRKNEKQKATQKRKAGAAQAAGARSAEIRREVMKRANGICEACFDKPYLPMHLDHWLSGVGRRRAKASVATCWALCRTCHENRTENWPSAAAWNVRFATHCSDHGYPFTPHVEHAQLPGRAAR
jgi:hypothetical protein